jgi:hypothetical protein
MTHPQKSIDLKRYEVKYLNLREVLIANYSDFIQTMFGVDFGKSQTKEVKNSTMK